jgi:hypothetical protein
MELDLLIDDIVNELALDNEFGSEVLEPPDFFGINDGCRLDIGGDVFKIVLALAPVPDPVFGKRPGMYFEKERVKVWHMFPLRINRKYFPLLSYFNQGNTLIDGFLLYTLIFSK